MTAERTEMNALEAATLITRHLRDVTVARIEEMPHHGWGGDSDVWLVNDALVVRVPRRPEVAAALAVEECLLPRLAQRLSLRIPQFTHTVRAAGTGLPLFVAYPLIEGVPLIPALFQTVTASPAALEQFAAQLGAFLTTLHTFPLAQARACGVQGGAGLLHELARERLTFVRERVYPALASDERAWLDSVALTYLADPRHFSWSPTLCHGDLSSDHMLLAPARSGLSGIIDFGDMNIGDPAADFVWRYEYGDAFFWRVLAHYHAPVSDGAAFARVVAFRHALMPAYQIAWGLASENNADTEGGRAALRARMDAV